MASRRAPETFSLSPLRGGRRASRRRSTPRATAIALTVVILGEAAFVALASLL